MKHTITDDVNVNVNVKVDIPAEDLADLIEVAKNAALTVIAASAAAHILKQFFGKDTT